MSTYAHLTDAHIVTFAINELSHLNIGDAEKTLVSKRPLFEVFFDGGFFDWDLQKKFDNKAHFLER